jgi:hypothetical protein
MAVVVQRQVVTRHRRVVAPVGGQLLFGERHVPAHGLARGPGVGTAAPRLYCTVLIRMSCQGSVKVLRMPPWRASSRYQSDAPFYTQIASR